jgi:hypothetical protein
MELLGKGGCLLWGVQDFICLQVFPLLHAPHSGLER